MVEKDNAPKVSKPNSDHLYQCLLNSQNDFQADFKKCLQVYFAHEYITN